MYTYVHVRIRMYACMHVRMYACMRWVRHIVRMEDSRMPKRLFYGELTTEKRPQHKPKKRFKHVIKGNTKALHMDVDNWEVLTQSP